MLCIFYIDQSLLAKLVQDVLNQSSTPPTPENSNVINLEESG